MGDPSRQGVFLCVSWMATCHIGTSGTGYVDVSCEWRQYVPRPAFLGMTPWMGWHHCFKAANRIWLSSGNSWCKESQVREDIFYMSNYINAFCRVNAWVWNGMGFLGCWKRFPKYNEKFGRSFVLATWLIEYSHDSISKTNKQINEEIKEHAMPLLAFCGIK